MKTLLAIALTAISLGTAGLAHAHGVKPAQYGGVVQTASDLQFELVSKDGKPNLYIDDQKSVAGAQGKLTVLSGSDKKETDLTPGAGNVLVATDSLALPAGAKAVATVKFADGKTVTVRFAIK